MRDIMLAIKIPLKHLEKLRKILIEKEIIAKNYKILTESDFGYIPINKKISLELQNQIQVELKKSLKKNKDENGNIIKGNTEKEGVNEDKKESLEFQILEKDLTPVKKHPRSMSDMLKGKLTEDEIENLKTSFDIIGDVVILEIPLNLQEHKNTIGEATLDFTKRKAIFMKKSGIDGVNRTRQLEHIAGENKRETIHKEHGVRFKLDVKNVYFSPRLATERKRIAEQVKNGETILDMFAGVGPFPILIAKKHDADIYAVDINKNAISYMEENIKLNKLKGKITPILGDINEIANEKFSSNGMKFDRIIMNLPKTGKDFLDLAISLVKDNGIIHYYEFSDNYDSAIKRIKKIAKNHDKDVEVLATRKVKSSSPRQWHIVVDAKLKND